MEPISMIIAALGAGAIAATKDTAGTAVKDAYYITDIFSPMTDKYEQRQTYSS
ncbi:hypothetical protein [Nostoc sp.]|uniref:hypothetical protein n=1 Tax=Nostoc sp. TaxID=1180 RepID=UPI0035936108